MNQKSATHTAHSIIMPETSDLRTQVRRILFAMQPERFSPGSCPFLKNSGIDVRQVADGRSCVEEALQGKKAGMPFDIIFLAVDLPVLDGFSTAMLLRENDCARVIISVDSVEHYIQEQESRAAGCDLHVPVDTVRSNLESLFDML